jgi:hypothetical protein
VFDSLEHYRVHGEHHPISPMHVVKIVTALRRSLTEHFTANGIPDIPLLH